jgi:hypothetical protein
VLLCILIHERPAIRSNNFGKLNIWHLTSNCAEALVQPFECGFIQGFLAWPVLRLTKKSERGPKTYSAPGLRLSVPRRVLTKMIFTEEGPPESWVYKSTFMADSRKGGPSNLELAGVCDNPLCHTSAKSRRRQFQLSCRTCIAFLLVISLGGLPLYRSRFVTTAEILRRCP